jgi:hypothetical protein
MSNSIIAMAREIVGDEAQEAAAELATMGVPALRARYREVFKEDSRSNNGPYLRKRIQYRLQELAYGGLSERAKARIKELAADAPFRRRGFPVSRSTEPATPLAAHVPTEVEPPASKRDPRLPPPGTALRRQYGASLHVVVVEADGFVFGGKRYDSLSKVARTITGTSWNGFTFFGLTRPWGQR